MGVGQPGSPTTWDLMPGDRRAVHVASRPFRLQAGGFSRSVPGLASAISGAGYETILCITGDTAPCCTSQVRVLRFRGIGPLDWSPGLRSALTRAAKEGLDVIHSHGLWLDPNHAAAAVARRRGIPLVISPRGMLDPGALAISSLRKRLVGFLWDRRDLRRASCLHALTAGERAAIRRLGLTNPVALIPNGVDTSEFEHPPSAEVITSLFPALAGKKWLLFMSRVHPKKGLIPLALAWNDVARAFPEWVLVVAGPDEVGHRREVEEIARAALADGRLVFTGPVSGEERLALLSHAKAFVLPSFSEGFPMALLEAAACGLPILATPQCGFREVAEVGGGLLADPEAASLTRGLTDLLSLDDVQQASMGSRGRALVKERYTWTAVGEKMASVYEWLVTGGPAPACVEVIP